jgi:GxxExxY protein
METRELEELAARVLDAAAYEMAFAHELSRSGIAFERQKSMPLHYKETQLDCGYRLDLLVSDEIILELKCVETLPPSMEPSSSPI